MPKDTQFRWPDPGLKHRSICLLFPLCHAVFPAEGWGEWQTQVQV